MLDEIRAKRDEIYAIARKHKAEKLWVFGSCARREESSDSDVDFLVQFNPNASLFDVAALKESLEELFERKVDIVSAASLKDDAFSRRVLSERIRL